MTYDEALDLEINTIGFVPVAPRSISTASFPGGSAPPCPHRRSVTSSGCCCAKTTSRRMRELDQIGTLKDFHDRVYNIGFLPDRAGPRGNVPRSRAGVRHELAARGKSPAAWVGRPTGRRRPIDRRCIPADCVARGPCRRPCRRWRRKRTDGRYRDGPAPPTILVTCGRCWSAARRFTTVFLH